VTAPDLLAGATWRLARCEPGAERPAPDDTAWIAAPVPGTAALAWAAAYGDDAARGLDVDAWDWWYLATVHVDLAGTHHLELDGVATLWELRVDDAVVASGSSMWESTELVVGLETGEHTLGLCCAALRPVLDQRRPRPRWRSRLVADSGLRWVRTSLLGRMPALAPTWAPAGPWRAVHLWAPARRPPRLLDLSVSHDGRDGVVQARVAVDASADVVSLLVGSESVQAQVVDGVATGRATVPGAAFWWPRGHGDQPLYELAVEIDGTRTSLRRIGFRSVTADRSDGGFTLSVNGVRVFARGATWSPLDPVGLRDDDSLLRRDLQSAAEMGATMLRVVGTHAYESSTFWDLCDELGILVWQDAMLATLDPPDESEWLAAVAAELDQVLRRLQGRPSLAVVCGGTETEQQPTMMGLPADRRAMPVIESVIPAVVAEVVPGTPYVVASPSGGDLPTHSGQGVAHWFGVGGYRRPVEEVRRAAVRFAAECLPFATPPERWSLDGLLPGGVGDPAWRAGVPADRDTDWDFLDVTDHYVADFFAELADDSDRGMDLRRAAAAHAMSEVFSEWRRDGSTCAGGLVLEWRDRVAGPGWGLLDVDGVPKATWHALRRVLAPVAVLLTDEGLDGLRVHVVNDRPEELDAVLAVTVVGRRGAVEDAFVPVHVPAHGSTSTTVDGVLGVFRDVTHAYGFGDAQYSAVRVVLSGTEPGTDEGVELAAVRRLLPDQHLETCPDPGLTATFLPGQPWQVEVSTHGLAPWVVVEAPGFVPSDSWFHLLPGESRLVTLVAVPGAETSEPVVTVRSLAGGGA
jgi:beta-mannosidase